MGDRRRLRALSSWFPHGGTLPAEVWDVRHRWVVTILLVQVPLLLVFALAQGVSPERASLGVLLPLGAAVVALMPRLPRRLRATASALGLMLVSAVLVHVSSGAIEAHFHFFVMIPVVALYEDWLPFGFATGYVLFHHGIVGSLASHAVYDHMDGQMHPWKWAAVHTIALTAACAGTLVSWKLHERAREEQALLTAELGHQALHDALTGLPNRTALAQHGRRKLGLARGRSQPVSVLLIDLVRFKEVNDTLGHAAGDALLCQVAERLRGQVRADDLLARLGGDEFALVLPGRSTDEARHVASRIRIALSGSFAVEGIRVDAHASIGIAGVRGDGSLIGDPLGEPYVPLAIPPGAAAGVTNGDDQAAVLSETLRRADVAMYVAKRSQQSAAVYTRAEDAHDRSNLELVDDLRRQLTDSSMELRFQPKLDLRTGGVTGMEALVRWKHPERGLLLPDDFLELAESSGLIEPLTLQVVHLALAQVARWAAVGITMPVAVNISPRCWLCLDLPSVIQGELDACGVDPSMLSIEITEDTVMADPEHVIAAMQRLRDGGVRLSIDDFGSGYAGLSYLRRLPVDELKLDQQFIACLDEPNLCSDDPDMLIVRSTVELGRNLGLTVVAEGVETQEALDALTLMGCDQGQGFLVSRPLPADLATAWLTSHRRRPVGLPVQRPLGPPRARAAQAVPRPSG